MLKRINIYKREKYGRNLNKYLLIININIKKVRYRNGNYNNFYIRSNLENHFSYNGLLFVENNLKNNASQKGSTFNT